MSQQQDEHQDEQQDDQAPPTQQGEQAQQGEQGEQGEEAEVALDGTPREQIEKERRERTAAENRPENSEVDNTQREFDMEKGMFTDDPGYEDAPKKYPPPGQE